MTFLIDNNKYRNKTLPVRGKALQLPIYFPSVSSLKTGSIPPFDYYKILKALGQPHFLLSAFDISSSSNKNEFVIELEQNIKNDEAIILLDSGNYESFWLRNKDWNIKSFNQLLNLNICDLAFSFDKQNPPNDTNKNIAWIKSSMNKSQNISKKASIIPIVHSKREVLSSTVIDLYNQNNFTMVSIPERNLGNGLIERVKTITNLRKELNKLDNYVYIHILGTGNPLSLILLSFAGADSFDGLEWCQTVVDADTALLYHFQQRELISDDCAFCSAEELDYTLSTLGHNLNFYNIWMKRIQDSIATNTESELLSKYFNPKIIDELNTIWS